ncbi:MAG: hypothetical protein L6R43_12445 [Planctomycetes bacterium]|nr:hypothetical protein [Planctomycetota bacterium]
MRITIDIPAALGDRLRERAARRGMGGLSKAIADAIEGCLRSEEGRDAKVRDALALRGCLSEAAARRLRNSVRRLRTSWR